MTQYPLSSIQGIKQHTGGGEFQLVIGGRMPSAQCSNSRANWSTAQAGPSPHFRTVLLSRTTRKGILSNTLISCCPEERYGSSRLQAFEGQSLENLRFHVRDPLVRAKNPKATEAGDLFRARLGQIINMKHELLQLAFKIDWDWIRRETPRPRLAEGLPELNPARPMLGFRPRSGGQTGFLTDDYAIPHDLSGQTLTVSDLRQ